MPRRHSPKSSADPALERARESEKAAEPERERPLTREVVEFETGREGTSGTGLHESGTLPGSVGGTTGNTDRAAGAQAPGASAPPIPGIDPARARGLVGKHRRGAEQESAGEESTGEQATGEESTGK